jgi:hypothetical protein
MALEASTKMAEFPAYVPGDDTTSSVGYFEEISFFRNRRVF